MNSTIFSPFALDTLQLDVAATIAGNQLVVGTTAVAAGALWYLLKSDKGGIKRARGWPLVGQWAFFTR